MRLDNLGKVEDKWSEPRRLARYNGQEAVTFNFLRSRTASEVKVADKVREEVKRLNETHPELTIRQVTASVEQIEESYLASLEALLLGAVLAVIIVFIFLRDWRATFIAATAMPMSLIPTFAILGPMDQSLNVGHAAGPVADHRHPGRRRHRGDREHRPPHARRQTAL